MKSTILLLTAIPLIFLAACSDPETPTAVQQEVAVHPEGWNKLASPDFHGKILAAKQYDASECQPCHGNLNSTDNKSLVGVSCRTCHASFPHRQGWANAQSPDFHGKALAAIQYNATTCQPCHGSDYAGGTSKVSCRTCHASFPHFEGWLQGNSASFHGKFLADKQFNAAECQPCHGNDYSGGTSKVACKTCHASYPHAAGWVGAHSTFIKTSGYNLNSCKSCHGQDYGTVKVNNSCLTCHTKPGGPEACNTCHGNASGDPAVLTNIAPPRGLDGETAATTPAVGAHQGHLVYYPSASLASTCQQCHALPQNFAAAGHINADGNAELLFNGSLVKLATEGGARVPNASYSTANNTCAGTYCHGNWGLLKTGSQYNFIYAADKIEGNSAAPKWTDAASAPCGTCHDLPPKGHNPFNIATCTTCHQGVIDANGKIIDAAKHINGKVNVFNQEYPMF